MCDFTEDLFLEYIQQKGSYLRYKNIYYLQSSFEICRNEDIHNILLSMLLYKVLSIHQNACQLLQYLYKIIPHLSMFVYTKYSSHCYFFLFFLVNQNTIVINRKHLNFYGLLF